jgi:hypothetical protein
VQVLQVIIVENLAGSNKGYPVTSAPIPLAPLFQVASRADVPKTPTKGARRSRSKLPPATLGLDSLGPTASGAVLAPLTRNTIGALLAVSVLRALVRALWHAWRGSITVQR